MTIEDLRMELAEGTRRVLSAIFDYYVGQAEWIPERELHARFGGKEEVKALLDDAGGDAVFLTEDPNEGFRRYELTLLGALLTQKAEELEQLLADYLTFAQEKALAEPRRVEVDSAEVEQGMRLNVAQVKLLGWMIRRGHQFASGGSYRDEGWTAKLPKNIEDLPEDILPYIRAIVAEGFDARKPIDPDRRRHLSKGGIGQLTMPISKDTGVDQTVLISPEITKGTRDYLETVMRQVNGCYAQGYYDACAVMLRRLMETLIIECFETHGVAEEVKNERGNFLGLDDLIRRFLSRRDWNVSRDARRHLVKLHSIKGVGDLSAHNRRFTATKNDIDRIADGARVAIQELASIAFDRRMDSSRE